MAAFLGRTYDEIRDQLLAEWAYQYTQIGKTLLTIEGSDASLWAGALALSLMAQEREAQVLQDQILPDRASLEFLLRHGVVDGLPRRAATSARLTVNVTGTPGGSAVTVAQALTSASGVRFSVTSTVIPLEGVLDGGGAGTLVITCTVAGAAGNLPVGTTVTWVAAPAGFNATATVANIALAGEDIESDTDYAARILANRQNRPASGNRQDWLNWTDAVSGVSVPYVYPNVRVIAGTATPTVLGAVLSVPIGPLPDDSSAPTRIVSTATCNHVAAYIEGTEDETGTAVPLASQIQLRPVTMPAGSYEILPATLSQVNVSMTLTLGAADDFPFTPPFGDYAIQAAPAPTTSTFFVLPLPNGQPVGSRLLTTHRIAVTCLSERGQYFLTTALVDGATGQVDVDPPIPTIPSAGMLVLPATALWSSVLSAVEAVFDALGPGDTAGTPSRWPPVEVQGRSTLYTSQIEAAALSVQGVISATLVLPAADVAAGALELHMLDTLTLRKT